MKYFFLTEGWTIGRVWSAEGLWNELAWRRAPDILRLNLCLLEAGEKLWLYRVEDPVLMVEVKPTQQPNQPDVAQPIAQVVLKRLISADQVIDRLGSTAALCQAGGILEFIDTNNPQQKTE